ncbi:MAG: transposase, partial [Bacteroidales bacterium]|nr:transposase [Bacteroidales bacterium]
MEKPYHLFCEGDYVLFRDDADYIFFNNRLAIAGLYARLTILAETIMSSHFHVIVETSNETALLNFMQTLKQGYSYHYSRKYG